MPYDTLSKLFDMDPLDNQTWIEIEYEARIKESDQYHPSMHPHYGIPQTEYQKQRVSEIMTGRKRSIQEKEKHYYSIMKTFNNPNYVHPHTGKPKSEEHRKNISKFHADISGENNPMYGKNHKDSTLEVLRERAKNRTKSKCPHCNKLIDASNYKRWHGDNCKEYIIARQKLGLQP
jgi:ribosomal protein L37AE/L43A